MGEPDAPLLPNTYFEAPPASLAACSPPSTSTYFLPAKRTSDNDLVPFSLPLTTAAFDAAVLSTSTRRAVVVATTFLPLRMFSCTLGPEPSQFSEYSPAGTTFPLIVTSVMVVSEPLFASLAANALVANSNANPSSNPLVTFANFIWTPFSSRIASGTGSGRLHLGKKTCVSLPKAYNHAAGLTRSVSGRKPLRSRESGLGSPGPPNRK